jgi:membrane associated rhomboid family serine protease
VLKRFIPIIILVALCWTVFVVNNLLLHSRLNQFGIIPRQIAGLPGIVLAPLLHGSFHHILANTVPLFILGAILCARNQRDFYFVTFAGTVFGGGLIWLFARNASHIGASGLIFCYFGYLASLAFFTRTFGTLILSILCILFYGGMVKGILPVSAGISWESHAAGLIAGIVLAWLSSNETKKRRGVLAAGS